MAELLYLSDEDVRDVASMAEYVDAVREAYRERGRGAVIEPRAKLYGPDPESFLLYYGALLPEFGVMGTYSYVTGFAGDETWVLTYLLDGETGDPLAIVDSPSLNPYKTGATGGVGVDALARENATTVGIIGSGTQARAQLLATAVVRDLDDVAVYSPTRSNREAFAAEFDDRLDATVRAVDSAAAAVEERDIVVTATRATTPVFDGESLAPGTHVTAMGKSHPEHRELDVETVSRARYMGDHRDRVERSSGSYRRALDAGAIDDDHFHAELGDVVSGAVTGRQSQDEITVFDSGGTGLETIAASYAAYERAVACGRGTSLTLTPGRSRPAL